MPKYGIIIGTGPSLRDVDLSLIDNHTSVCVNASIMKYPKADYFFSCDATVTLRTCWLIVPDLECKVVLAQGGSGFDCFSAVRGIKVVDEIDPSRIIRPKRQKSMKFGDPELVWGKSSAHPAANFLYNLGCDTLILLGCDCKTVDGKRYYYDYDGETKDEFVNDAYAKASFKKQFYGPVFKGEWEGLVRANGHVNFVNCSNADIDGMPKMTLKEALNG